MVFLFKNLFLFLLFAFASFFVSCNDQGGVEDKNSKINTALQRVDQIAHQDGAEIALKYIDSICAGKKLVPEDEYKVLYARFDLYRNKLNDLRNATIYVDSLLLLTITYPDQFDSTHIFTAYMQKANTEYASENYAEAFKYYDMARDVVFATKSPCQEYVYTYRLAMSYYKEEKYTKAADLFKEAYSKSIACGSKEESHIFRQQEFLSNIGLSYYNAGMIDSSVFFYRKALAFIEENRVKYPANTYNWDEALSVVEGNIGSAYAKIGSYDSAEFYFKESIALNERIKRNYKDRLFNILKLADLYVTVGKKDEAMKMLARFDEVYQAKKTGQSEEVIELTLRKVGVYMRYYQQAGDVNESLHFMHLYDSLREIKWRSTKKVLVNNIEMGLDNADHEKHILFLNKDMQIRKQQNVILALAIILTVTVIVLIYRSLRQYSKKYERLEYETEQITRDSAAKEAQLKRKMRQDELNFMALIENTDDFLWSVDREFNLLAFNKAYNQHNYLLTGQYPEIGKPEPILKYRPESYEQLVSGYRVVLSGQPYNVIQKGLPVRGEAPDIEVRLNPLKDEEGNMVGIIGFRRDITDYVKMIDTLEDNYKTLKDIAWMQSHKVRGPLTTMMAILEYLESDDKDETLRTEMFLNLRKKVEEMDAIIRDIVDKTY
jgi:PAS domain S-box-containing protein